MQERILAYFETLDTVLHAIKARDAAGCDLALDAGIEWVIDASTDAHRNGNKVMFIGNGGSAGIASHMAIDYSKNGNIRALAFNDGAALTCLGNDLGYENVFAKQLDMHARPGDLLMAISSSGRSRNILNSVEVARKRGCKIVTLSGFSGDNPLRQAGTFGHGSVASIISYRRRPTDPENQERAAWLHTASLPAAASDRRNLYVGQPLRWPVGFGRGPWRFPVRIEILRNRSQRFASDFR